MATGRWERFWTWLSLALERQEREARAEDEEPSFRDRFFLFRTLEPRLKFLTGVVLAHVVAAALLLFLPEGARWTLPVFDASLRIPIAHHVLGYICTLLAVIFLTIGMYEARWAGALTVMFFVVVVLAIGIFGVWKFESAAFKLSLVFTIFFWCAAIPVLPRAYRARYSPERQRLWVPYLIMAMGVSPFVLLLMAPVILAELLLTLRVLLVYLFMLAGTDWAELNDTLIRSIAKSARLRERPRIPLNLTLAISGLLSAVLIISTGGRVFPHFVVAVIEFAFVMLILRLAGLRGDWPVHFPWAGLVLFVMLYNVVGDVILASHWNFHYGAPRQAPQALIVYNLICLALAAPALVASGRSTRYLSFAPVLLFALLVFCAGLLWALPNPTGNVPPVVGVMFAITALSFLTALGQAWRARQGEEVGRPAELLFVLNAGVLLLYLLWTFVYNFMQRAEEWGVLIAALILFVSIGWDIVMSGKTITNVEGKLFSRRARVYLFLGYVLLTVATIVFWSSMLGSGIELQVAKLFGNTDFYVQIGIALYGPAMLVALFLLRRKRNA
ncbi:MAG: hypothetical protein ACREQP_20910 [Candidatus Binatia bacterium]